MKQQIILIGGAPTTGKSIIAQLLSEKLNIPWISTDAIRTIMQEVCNTKDHPSIFRNENYTGEEFLTKFSSEEIVKMEHEENDAVWKGVCALIKDGNPWNSFIIEGIAIEPHLIARDLSGNARIKTIFLVDEDENRIRDVIFNRGLWDSAKSYSDDVKEKEVAWVREYGKNLKEEAQKYGFPCVEVAKENNDIRVALAALNLSAD